MSQEPKEQVKNPDYLKTDKPTQPIVTEKIYEWQCSEKQAPQNPCNSDPRYIPPGALPPDKCNGQRTFSEPCESNSFDKTGEKIKTKQGDHVKIIDSKSKSVIKEYTEMSFDMNNGMLIKMYVETEDDMIECELKYLDHYFGLGKLSASSISKKTS